MTLQLPRLQSGVTYFEGGRPTLQMQLFWDRVATSLETAFNANEELDANQTELIASVQTAINTANDAIERLEAQDAMERTRDSSAAGLTITPGATDIVISNHTRSYLDPTETVNVTGATISGLSAATTYYIHYTDPDRAGGAVGYQVSTSYENAVATLTEPYRHFVGVGVTGGAGTPTPDPYWRLGL